MSGIEIATIVLSSISLIASIVSPIIISFSYLIKHVSESSCCGGHFKIDREEAILKVEEETDSLIKEYPKLLKSNPILINPNPNPNL